MTESPEPSLATLAAEVEHIEAAYRMALECGFAELAAEMQRYLRTNILPDFETLLSLDLEDEPGRVALVKQYQALWRLAGA
jgi:hypothetical protein